MTPRKLKAIQSAEKFMDGLCHTYGYNIDVIKSRRKPAYLVEKRAIVAQRLREQGFSLSVIGIVMNRDHTSILHLVNKNKAVNK